MMILPQLIQPKIVDTAEILREKRNPLFYDRGKRNLFTFSQVYDLLALLLDLLVLLFPVLPN